jgi:hypothetical protein
MYYYYIRSYQHHYIKEISFEDFLRFEADDCNYVMMSAIPLELILEEEFSY